ncbi:ribonuclease H-like domain-containing protein [Tanacetum coccineum]
MSSETMVSDIDEGTFKTFHLLPLKAFVLVFGDKGYDSHSDSTWFLKDAPHRAMKNKAKDRSLEKVKLELKNKVLFTDTKCLVVSPDFKLPDENQVLLRVPRQHNMYSFSLENSVPSEGLTCLIAKASSDESNKWHRRLGHVNFKNLNKLVKGNLVRGLPSQNFQNDHTCVACQKGKQHKALIGSLYTRKI